MPAIIHSGKLQRWYEELCRFDINPVRQLAIPAGTELRPNCLSRDGAVYVFWWTGDLNLFRSPDCMRDLIVKGPGRRDIEIRIDDEWLGLEAGFPIPLYVGKTTGLRQRVRQHLEVGRQRLLRLGGDARRAERPTTACQLRAGIDHLFPNNPDTRSLVLDSVALSYIVLDGDENSVNRFYLEDYAIGLMKPCLNVDVER